MEAVVGLLLMLLTVSHGVETYCDGRQNETQCYGASGGTVVFRLMDDVSEIPAFVWTKETQNILRWTDNKIILNKMENRSLFIPSNGTLRINNINRGDSGEYSLTMFDSQGRLTGTRTLQLTVEAPVSSVQLVSECLSQGEMKVSCSPNGGDSLQYSWTLGGHTLRDTELLSGNNETNVITLKQNVSGHLVCSVGNQVSSVSKEEDISTCGFIFINCTSKGTRISMWVHKENKTLCDEPTTAPTTVTESKETEPLKTSTNTSSSPKSANYDNTFIKQLPVIGGVFAALVVLLLVGVAIICTQKRKKNSKAEEEDDQELTYADVRIVQKKKRQVEHKVEVEVEYGEVKFSERPLQADSAADDCVYAKVRKDR